MSNNGEFIDALVKKAKGFSSDEIVEEYSTDGEGALVLAKRKITTKYYPPDTAAIKSVMEMDSLKDLSDEELLSEKIRLLAELNKISEENKEKDEKESR